MKKELVCIILILCLGIASASFSPGNPPSNIETSYAPGSQLRGWINISLQNEPSDSLLTSNTQGSTKLLDFLNANDAEFSCIPADCKTSYTGQNLAESKHASLTSGQEKIYLVGVRGNISSIDKLDFSISSNAGKSCLNPLKISLGDEFVWQFNSSSNDFSCTQSIGCYEDDKATLDSRITETPYCEKINLQQGSKFELGAWVKKGTDTAELKMQMYNLDEEKQAECILPAATSSGGIINCKVNIIASGDYYLCISADKATDWIIKSETNNPCGSFGFPFRETRDVYVYAKNAKFNEPGVISIKDSHIQNNDYESLSSLIQDYISTKYDNKCDSACYIPIKIISGLTQDITINNVKLDYTTESNALTTSLLYDSTESPVKINSGFQKLDLEKSNLTVTGAYGSKVLKLYLSGNLIDSESINIIQIAEIKSLSPLTAAAGVPTAFTLEVSNKTNLTYSWTFGDGSTEETKTNKVTHTYTEIDEYELKVKIADKNNNENSKTFSVSVFSPKDIIPQVLQEKRRNLKNIENKTLSLPSWVKTYFSSIINTVELNRTLNDLTNEYNESRTDQEYIDVAIKLNNLNIPENMLATESGSIIFVSQQDSIDLEKLKEAGAGAYESDYESDYKDAVSAWGLANTDSIYDFKVYSFVYANSTQPAFSYFKLSINPPEKVFLILEGNPVFAQDYGQEKHTDYYSLSLESQETLEFLYSGKAYFDSVYFSPEFRLLNVGPVTPVIKKIPYGWIFLFVTIILIISFGVYIFLQQWYKRNYEISLFGNRNDLFNIINFIKNATFKGLSEKEIRNNLKKAGWNGEQIIYAINKAKGRPTGLPEIPLLSLFNLFKRKQKETLNNPRTNQYNNR